MAANYALPDCILCRIIGFLQPGVLPQSRVSSAWCFAARRVLEPIVSAAKRVLKGSFQVDCLEDERITITCGITSLGNFINRLSRLLSLHGLNPELIMFV